MILKAKLGAGKNVGTVRSRFELLTLLFLQTLTKEDVVVVVDVLRGLVKTRLRLGEKCGRT